MRATLRLLAMALLAAALLTQVGCAVEGGWPSPGEPRGGQAGPGEPSSGAHPAAAPSSALQEASPSPRPATPSVPLRPPYPPPAESARLLIPSIGVDAPLIPVGVNAEGEVESPTEAAVVGWYNLSPPPGGPGNSVLVGHVDWQKQAAVFWRLHELRPGSVILLSENGFATARFRVDWVQTFHIEAAPIEVIFASTRESRITLITCEGAFDPVTRNYLHRLVVRASRIDS